MGTAGGRDTLLDTITLMRDGFVTHGCPFYDEIGGLLAADVTSDGPVAALLAPYAEAPFESAYILRLLGRVHRLVLAGDAPTIAAHFPSAGGDGDARAAFAAIADLVTADPGMLGDWDARPPQTNEVGRSAALMSGLLVVADDLRLPLSVREIGSSAGLNLRLDRYWYEQDGAGWGDRGSEVRFIDHWRGGGPPFGANLEIADRRGCDPDPVDATSEDGALTLLSYIWPQPPARFDRARSAISIAQSMPVTIDRADAREWVPDQLRDRRQGAVLVIMHSVMWQYLDDATRDAVRSSIEGAGRGATPDTPVAWVRLEPNPEFYVPAELRITVWDGTSPAPRDQLLATTGFHGGQLDWTSAA
jgi:hypothetical protein